MKIFRSARLYYFPVILLLIFLFSTGRCPVNAQNSRAREKSNKYLNRALANFKKNPNVLTKVYPYVEDAINADKTNDKAFAFRARVYAQNFREKEAEKDYLKAISLNPRKAEYRIELARVFKKTGDRDKAGQQLEKALELAPGNIDYKFSLTEHYSDTGKKETAIKMSQELIESPRLDEVKKIQLHKILGDYHFEKGNMEKARQHYEVIMNSDKAPDAVKIAVKEGYALTEGSYKAPSGLKAGLVVVVIAMILLAVFWKFIKKFIPLKDTTPKASFSLSKARDYDTMAEYAVERFKVLTKLPRVLVYVVKRDGEPLSLVKADGISPDGLKELEFNQGELVNWLGRTKGNSFIFSVEKKEADFLKAFPGIREKLGNAEPRVGIPLIYHDYFRGMVFMAGPQISDMMKLRRYYEKNIPFIMKESAEIATVAEKIYRKEISTLDFVTGVFNRSYFEEKIKDEATRCIRKHEPLGLIMLEIEKMALVGQRFGNDKRDQVIRTFAQTLKTLVEPAGGLLFRNSDYAFAILMPRLDYGSTSDLAECCVKEIMKARSIVPIPELQPLTGLACIPDTAKSSTEMENQATENLNKAISKHRSKLMQALEEPSTSHRSFMAPRPRPAEDDLEFSAGPKTDSKPGKRIETMESMHSAMPIAETFVPPDSLIKSAEVANTPGNMDIPAVSAEEKPADMQDMTGTMQVLRKPSESDISPLKPKPAITDSGSPLKKLQTNAERLMGSGNIESTEEYEKNLSMPGLASAKAGDTGGSGGLGSRKATAKPTMRFGLLKPRQAVTGQETISIKPDAPSQPSAPVNMPDITPASSVTGQQPPIELEKKAEKTVEIPRPAVTASKIAPISIGIPKIEKPVKAPPIMPLSPKFQPEEEKQDSIPSAQAKTDSQMVHRLGIKKIKPLEGGLIPGEKKAPQPTLLRSRTQDSVRDLVTGFFIRTYFEQSLKALLASSTSGEISMVFFKLDMHKSLKEKFGIEKLNGALEEIGAIAGRFLREGSDIPCRYSDEIFAIIVPDSSPEVTLNVAEQIRQAAGSHSFKDIPGSIRMTFGISTFPSMGTSPNELMKHAYDAMISALKSGGFRSSIWNQGM